VLVGRKVFDYLVDVLGVDPKYVTTCVTRMGARVTVDWRAFGPRRLHQILAVVRYVETKVFAVGELECLGVRLHRAMTIQARRLDRRLEQVLEAIVTTTPFKASVTIDGGIYRVSERAT